MFFDGPSLNYEPPIFRPPSEANSLLIQLTIGCSNNSCTYCEMYRSKKFRVRDHHEVIEELRPLIENYKKRDNFPRKIFICDGDALSAPMSELVPLLEFLNQSFPDLNRIGIYTTAQNILEKSSGELEQLKKLKLTMAYLGLETGSDLILKKVAKGNTKSEMIQASLMIKTAGWKLSTIAMLGLGGREFSELHVKETAEVISKTSPHFFSFLTTMALPNSPYSKQIQKGIFTPLTTKELLVEMKSIIKGINCPSNSIIFRANHISNLYPLAGVLPKDSQAIENTLNSWSINEPAGLYPPLPSTM